MTTEAIFLLKNRFHLSFANTGFQKGNTWKHFFSNSYHLQEIQKIIAVVERKIIRGSAVEKAEYLSLANALIARYKSDRSLSKILSSFDRQVAPFRPSLTFLYPPNKKMFQKWKKARQSVEIFRDFPRFTDLLESSLLLSQIKITRDKVQIFEGEPAILVEGKWVKEPDFYRRFQVVESKVYDQKFIIDKETREVYTYLDNGQGLQKHHPYLSSMTPICTLNEEDYQHTWTKACEFVRSEEINMSAEARALRNQNRPFILQFVTSKIQEGTSHFHELFRNSKHPYLRLIIGHDHPELNTHKGEIYEVGYGWKEVPCLPLLATTGRFRSPDVWEYKTVDEKIVTNIPLSMEEAHRFYRFCVKYHRDGVNLGAEPGFHLVQQNCSVFTREACKSAGIVIPTEIQFKDALFTMAPDILRQCGKQIQAWQQRTSNLFYFVARCIIPIKALHAFTYIRDKILQMIDKIRSIAIAFILIPLHALLGGLFGQGGPAFRQAHERPRNIEPQFNWRNYFNLSEYKFHLPAISQKWQLQQPSTVVYPNPVKLAIVPP